MIEESKTIRRCQYLLILLPFLMFLWVKDDVVAAFEDRRPIYRAERLEEMFAAGAGERIEAPTFVATVTHEVQPGETWSSIARQYGVSDANALANVNGNIPLMAGGKVKIPPELRSQP